MNRFETAVIVPAHAAFKASVDKVPENFREADPWVFLDYQRNGGYYGRGEQTLYIEHIESGLLEAASSQSSVLVFSGGHTREEAGNGTTGWSEGASYYGVALRLIDELGISNTGVQNRILVEEQATDSFQNLANSAALFAKTMRYPSEDIHVHGFTFKALRYQQHHDLLSRDSVLTQIPRLVYISVNNPVGADLAPALRGEAKTREEFERFPRGDGGILLKKRQQRTFPNRQSPYPQEVTVANFLARHGNPPTPQPQQVLRTPVGIS